MNYWLSHRLSGEIALLWENTIVAYFLVLLFNCSASGLVGAKTGFNASKMQEEVQPASFCKINVVATGAHDAFPIPLLLYYLW